MQTSNPTLNCLIGQLDHNPAVVLIKPTDEQYPSLRLVYNRMHDCYPGLIVHTMDVDALRLIMAFAFEHDIVLAIRGAGHHIGGFGTCNDGIVLDFSSFKTIHVDSDKNIASVAPGVCLGELDKTLNGLGYIIPTGTVSETGVAGLTLGGGIGWLTGKYGLTCDQLCAADVLLADGQLIHVDATNHSDLLWALRGGGGNFGIVLNFIYTLNPLPKTVCGMGMVSWDNVARVMSDLIQYLTKCPQSMTIAPVFTKDKQGKPSLRIDFCCADGTDEDVSQLLSLSKLVGWSEVREWEFAAWQKEFDAAFMPPMRGYWKAAYLETITSEIIKKLCDAFEHSPSPRCSILLEHLHGQFKQYGQSTSAFPLRHCNFGILLTARWEEIENDAENISWVRQSFNEIDPQGMTGTYLNYTSADDKRAVDSLLAGTMSQIVNIKSIYDPHNYFKRNHNVQPNEVVT